jgi:hypothetical protein
MSNISPNPAELSPELVEALKAANSPDEMKEIQRNFWISQGGERDRFNRDKILLDNVKSFDEAATGTVSCVVKIAGRDQTFSASDLLQLEKNINAALLAAGGAADANANAGTERSTLQARDPRSGQFIDPTNPAVIAELRLAMARGEISPEQFIAAQPQLLDEYARTRLGIDPEKIAGDRFANSWTAATEEFLNSPEGADWPGGEANKEILGRILQENNLVDKPSVETLAAAYRHAKTHGLLVKNPEIENQKAIGEATSFEDLRQAAWKSAGGRPSSFWSR